MSHCNYLCIAIHRYNFIIRLDILVPWCHECFPHHFLINGSPLCCRDVDELSELSEQRSVGSSEPWSDSDGEGDGLYPNPDTVASRELSMLAGELASLFILLWTLK